MRRQLFVIHKQIVLALHESQEINRYCLPLVNQLKERMLTICPWLPKINFTDRIVDLNPKLVHSFSVRLLPGRFEISRLNEYIGKQRHIYCCGRIVIRTVVVTWRGRYRRTPRPRGRELERVLQVSACPFVRAMSRLFISLLLLLCGAAIVAAKSVELDPKVSLLDCACLPRPLRLTPSCAPTRIMGNDTRNRNDPDIRRCHPH